MKKLTIKEITFEKYLQFFEHLTEELNDFEVLALLYGITEQDAMLLNIEHFDILTEIESFNRLNMIQSESILGIDLKHINQSPKIALQFELINNILINIDSKVKNIENEKKEIILINELVKASAEICAIWIPNFDEVHDLNTATMLINEKKAQLMQENFNNVVTAGFFFGMLSSIKSKSIRNLYIAEQLDNIVTLQIVNYSKTSEILF